MLDELHVANEFARLHRKTRKEEKPRVFIDCKYTSQLDSDRSEKKQIIDVHAKVRGKFRSQILPFDARNRYMK